MLLSPELERKYQQAGQGHVLEYFQALPDEERGPLKAQLEEIPVEKLSAFLEAAQADATQEESRIAPFSKAVHRSTDTETASKAYAKGLEAIAKGTVAALVLAGGQGTRLGFSGPKGMYDIGLPSGRTLFQLNAERILKLRQLAAKASADNASADSLAPLPFYIMTSPINHEETIQYFKDNNYFGLPADDVRFFQQGLLPCLSLEDGKILMETKSKIAMAPDGNGGIYPALVNSGTLKDMQDRKIEHLHVFSIDNALNKPADPTFVGQCILESADCGNKVVWKASAHEKVGVIAEKDGKPCVVEYSEITKEMAEKVDEKDRLVFGAGNICNHYYTISFVNDKVLPNLGNLYHIAKKKIPVWDKESQTTVKPTENNGIKLESFIFDVFPMSERMTVLDVLREDEFAPVKNAPGSASDSPDTARALLSQLAIKWVSQAGGVFSKKGDGISEIAPLTSYGGEDLDSLVSGKEVTQPISL